MKYEILCEVDNPASIYLSGGLNPDRIVCEGGQLLIQPHSPVLGDLTYSQVGELAGATLLLFITAFLFRYVFQKIQNR